ncbi:PAS domain S-box protein [Candidatus Bathyarchaeota archaeon]|nr:PAS domain S-box protein [Candidatus Bathyarchaeota archaeon]
MKRVLEMKKNECKEKDLLKYASEKLRILLDGIDGLIYIADPDSYEILFVNQVLSELVGGEVEGKKCYKILQNLNHPCPFCSNKHIFGRSSGRTYIWERQDRTNERWYKCVDKAIEWLDGRKVRLEIAFDITGYRKIEKILKETNERLEALVQAIPDAVFFKDVYGHNLVANKAFEDLVGLKQEEIVGKTDQQVFPKDLADRLRKADEEVLRKRQILRFEEEIVGKDGEKRFFEAMKAPIIGGEGDVAGLVGIGRDITEHKRTRNALKESEEMFRSIVENSHDAIIILDDEYKICYINEECVRLSGYPKEEIIGHDFRAFLEGESKSLAEERYLLRQQRGNAPSEYELYITRKDGKRRYVKIKSSVIQDSQGSMHTIGQLLDITENEKMHKETKRFERRLSALNRYAQDLNKAESTREIYALTLKAMEKTLGFEHAAFMVVEGRELRPVKYCGYPGSLDFRLSLDRERGVTAKTARTGRHVYLPDVRREKIYVAGAKGMLSELAVPIKAGEKVLGVLNVESKRLAAFDERDKRLLEILASHAAIAISNMDRHTELEEIYQRLANLMKSSTEIMKKKAMHQRLRVIAKAIRRLGWQRVVISLRDENLEGTDTVTVGLSKEEVELLLKRKASGDVWRQRLGLKFERFKIGEFYYLPWENPWIREQVHGITPGTPLEKASTYAGVPSKLSREEMVDWHPQDMLYAPLHTPEGRIVGILSMDDPVDGRKPTRESLTPLELFLHQAAMVIENAQLIESLREARKQLEAYTERLEQKVEERTHDLKRSQEQLLKAQRLAVIGELSGMVGHDLRNPLTSINAAAYYLKKRLGSQIDGKVREMIELIEKNITYSNKIINDLLDYSREMKLDIVRSSPKRIVQEALALVEIPNAVILKDLTKNRPKIRVDFERIKRAFINLTKNAIDAMPKGGTLTIETRKSKGNLRFVFSDTGVGMSRRTLNRLWTPLFTTKAKGMGFGLPICKRIVDAHGGSISVKSARGKGTTFIVTIPLKSDLKGGEKIWVKPPGFLLSTMTKT